MERLLAHEPKPILVVDWSPTCQLLAGHPPDELITLLREVGYSPAILSAEPDTRTIDDVLREVRAGTKPPSWYAKSCLHADVARLGSSTRGSIRAQRSHSESE